MSAPEETISATATELRLATFRLAKRLREHRAIDGMSDAQLGVLGFLRMHGSVSLSALAQSQRVTSPTMTSTINGLELLGIVVREPDPADLRRVNVELTEAGHDVAVRTVTQRDRALAKDLAELQFTDEELATLRDASALIRRVTDQ